MSHRSDALDYPGVGATAKSPAHWPEGFRTLRVSSTVGRGDAAFAAAADAVMTWRLHRTAGVRFGTGATRAAEGVKVVVGLGAGPLRLHAPCRVVWTVEEERRTGWAYGTLPGHPVRGEEAFVVVQNEDGTVRLEVLAFSLPSSWFTVAAGPLLPVFQRWYARRCGRVLRRLVREETGAGGPGHGPRAAGDESGIDRTEHP
ncbi:DUF1990 family protein [Streptomyces sp. WMMB 322]|uniref:DUF1990 family protein n=1 Tax=Streptomyces sp. WMMB 322 TaxID=1286821 RepID=UPI000D14F3D7|nr:DUF1990 domain-containing protein [Streptomyces sp. WMMB 322]